jgi:hypothetical protein
MGRKSVSSSGLFSFGLRTMAVSLIPGGIIPVAKNSLTACITSSCKKSQ